MSKTVIGLIGCGNISDAYLRGAARSNAIRVKACSDLRPEAAQAKAAEYGVSAMPVQQLLADPEISIVVPLYNEEHNVGPLCAAVMADFAASPMQSDANTTSRFSSCCSRSATGFKLNSGVGLPFGRPRCDARITVAPCSSA